MDPSNLLTLEPLILTPNTDSELTEICWGEGCGCGSANGGGSGGCCDCGTENGGGA